MELYSRFIIVSLLFLSCSHENPFTNPSLAKMHIISPGTTFKTEAIDTVNIFSSQTLTLAATVYEQIDSFLVEMDKNRYWTDTVIPTPSSEYYNFKFSVYDTGLQTISITTFRSNGDKHIETVNIYSKNPLHQKDIPRSDYSDSIQLATDSVDDHDNVIYIWSFGSYGTTIQSPYPKLKALIATADNLNNQGTLWISDRKYTSPKTYFNFAFFDSTPPAIVCVNDNFNKASKTITTSDSVFSFRVRITDRGDQKVDSVAINGDTASFVRSNVYTSVISNLQNHPASDPFTVVVVAIDNKEHLNIAKDTFSIIFDPSSVISGNTSIEIFNIKESVSTMRNTFTIFGSAENTIGQTMLLKPFINNSPLDAIIVSGYGTWDCAVSLLPGENSFYILARDTTGNTQDSQLVKIFYQSTTTDTVPPKIIRLEVDGKSVDNSITNKKNVLITITAFDAGSGIKKVYCGKDSVSAINTEYQWNFTIFNLSHDENKIPIRITDQQNNFVCDTLKILQNTLPTIETANLFSYVVFAGQTYTDTILVNDADHDPVRIVPRYLPAGMNLDDNGIIRWTPSIQDTGIDSIVVQLYDNIQITSPKTWIFHVIDSSFMRPKINIAEDIQIPAFLEADSDSLKVTIKVNPGTGNGPFVYSADLVSKQRTLLSQSRDSVIRWIPSGGDTGIIELRIIAEDNLHFSDTIFRSIFVVPENKDSASLLWETENHIENSNAILVNSNDTTIIHFTINDDDNSLTEQHIITIETEKKISSFIADSESFDIKIQPDGSKMIDTLKITLLDKTGASDTVELIIYRLIRSPDQITNTVSWFNDSSFASDGTSLNVWNSLSGGTINLSKYYNNMSIARDTINSHDAVVFDNNDDFLIAMDQGNYFNEEFTIFFVARYDSLNMYQNLTLLSSSQYDDTLTGLGISTNGYAGVFSSGPYMVPPVVSPSDLIVTPKEWHVISYRSNGIEEGKLKTDIRIDGLVDSVILPKAYECDHLMLGAGIKHFVSHRWNGLIAEVIIYQRKLTDNEWDMVELYLRNKFGLNGAP